MKKYVIISISALLLLCTSCAKRTESKLVGTWKVETVGDCGWPEDPTWTFYSGGNITIHHDAQLASEGEANGEYEVFTRSLLMPYLRFKGMGDMSANGIWRVEKCNSKKLVINRVEWLNGETQGAFLRREFTKN
jgi:hypothetical protein